MYFTFSLQDKHCAGRKFWAETYSAPSNLSILYRTYPFWHNFSKGNKYIWGHNHPPPGLVKIEKILVKDKRCSMTIFQLSYEGFVQYLLAILFSFLILFEKDFHRKCIFLPIFILEHKHINTQQYTPSFRIRGRTFVLASTTILRIAQPATYILML